MQAHTVLMARPVHIEQVNTIQIAAVQGLRDINVRSCYFVLFEWAYMGYRWK
jgi:hypothetical protein